MGQKTAKTVVEVLEWIESTPHHLAAWRTKDGRDYARHGDPSAVMELRGHHEKLRIPLVIQQQTRDLIEPGSEFDTRMYRANSKGRRLLRAALTKANQGTQSPLSGES